MLPSRYLPTAAILAAFASQSCFFWAPVLPENTAVRVPGGYCVVQHRHLRRIPDDTTFNNLGFVVNEVNDITQDQLGSIDQGPPMPHLDHRLWESNDGKIYVMSRGIRRLVPGPETLHNLWIPQQPGKLTSTLAESLPEGPPLLQLPSRLMRGPDGRIYLIVEGIFRYVPDAVTLGNLCIPQNMVSAPADVIASLPDGPALPHNANHCWNVGAM